MYVCVRVAGTVHVRQPHWYFSAGSAESWPSQHHGGVNQWNPIRRHQRWERSWAAKKAPTEAVRVSFHVCENTWVQVKPKVAYARLLCQVQWQSCHVAVHTTYSLSCDLVIKLHNWLFSSSLPRLVCLVSKLCFITEILLRNDTGNHNSTCKIQNGNPTKISAMVCFETRETVGQHEFSVLQRDTTCSFTLNSSYTVCGLFVNLCTALWLAVVIAGSPKYLAY